jgi:phage baseplate assembly protein W
MDAEVQKNVVRRRLLGRGLALTPAGGLGRDLVLRADGTDLAMVDGVDHFANVLATAVLTPLGGDVFNNDFGFDGLNALAEETTSALQRERVRVSIVTLLRKDRRVSRIVDVKLIDQRLEAPTTGAARTLDVRVAFETVSGDQLTLSAGNAGTRLQNG